MSVHEVVAAITEQHIVAIVRAREAAAAAETSGSGGCGRTAAVERFLDRFSDLLTPRHATVIRRWHRKD
jgi:hypothetical protein